MRKIHRIVSAAALCGLVSSSYLYAQPAKPAPGKSPAADVTVAGETRADLPPREIAETANTMIGEMDAMLRRVLELQQLAQKAKDVIKLNCVNENLLAVKQLLNIAERSRNEITAAIAAGNRDEQIHKFSQVSIANEKAKAARDEAAACIGDELIFVGTTKVDVDGPSIPDDPTDDANDPYSDFPVDVEHVTHATPYY